jgi:anti-anti-sigma factor
MNFAIATNTHDINDASQPQPRPMVRRKRPLAAVPEEMLSVHEERRAGEVVLHAYGQLDLVTVIPFRDAVFEAIGGRPVGVTLDLTAMHTIESQGISALVTLSRVAQMMKVTLTIQMPDALQDWAQESGLNRLLHPEPFTGNTIASAIFSKRTLE